jgi:hypothetical protein
MMDREDLLVTVHLKRLKISFQTFLSRIASMLLITDRYFKTPLFRANMEGWGFNPGHEVRISEANKRLAA